MQPTKDNGQKLTETEEDLLRHPPHGTAAFATLYIGCEKFPYTQSASLSLGGMM